MKSLQHYWYKSNILIWLLLPLSWLYCLVVSIRRKLYQLEIKRSYSSNVPIVVVGNVVVGGSGKTPLILSLCEYLISKGIKPGVVSRGYGGSFSGIKQVSVNDSARLVGDEPLMICQKASVPVVVGSDRVAAVKYLIDNNQCEVVLSDDGLQHYRMKRDFEIAVVDSSRRYGNGFCLPAGPLRERLTRLRDVDIVVYNGDTDVKPNDDYYQLKITGLQKLNGSENCSLTSFAEKKVHAVAGIGHPQRFFEQLGEYGIRIIQHAYPDHYDYQQNDFDGWEGECILMTEKDAVKCRHLSLSNACVVCVSVSLSSRLESSFSTKLLPMLNKKLFHIDSLMNK
jgi:tetraacyldisaccharide 4'-kinase